MADKTVSKIVLAALTYHRPTGLDDLLSGIAGIKCPNDTQLEVLIVDNSYNGTAQTQVSDWAQKFPFSLSYLHCQKRGLSPARNAALIAALGRSADALGFIDDDEVPTPDWLIAHLAALNNADVSIGSVEARYDKTPPNWLKQGGFLEVSGYPRHAEIPFGNTSNVLMRLEIIAKHKLGFEDSFSMTGGEDTHFFHQLLKKGAKIVFAPDAKVAEAIVEDRATLTWLLRRWRRTGQTNAQIRLIDRDGVFARLICAAGGVLRITAGSLMSLIALPFALLGRSEIPIKGLRIAARGLGFIDGAVGYRTEEYKVMTR